LTDYYRAEARRYLPDRAKTVWGRGEAEPVKKLHRGRLEPRQMPRGLHPWLSYQISSLLISSFGRAYRDPKIGGRWNPPPRDGAWLTLETRSSPTFYYRAKFRRCRSNRLGVSKRVPKTSRDTRGAPPPLGGGVADPLEMLLCHLCYHAKFGHSR